MASSAIGDAMTETIPASAAVTAEMIPGSAANAADPMNPAIAVATVASTGTRFAFNHPATVWTAGRNEFSSHPPKSRSTLPAAEMIPGSASHTVVNTPARKVATVSTILWNRSK